MSAQRRGRGVALLALSVATIAAGCERGQLAQRNIPETTNLAAETTIAGDSIRVVRERARDITGDGSPEHFRVVAHGASWDSLLVELTISNAAGRQLYVDRWWDDAEDSSDIDAVLGDSNFVAPGRTYDGGELRMEDMRGTVRGDVAEDIWRSRHHLDANAPLSAEAAQEVQDVSVPASRVETLTLELLRQPSFAYYAGGETTYQIAWSAREQRFVTIYTCC